MGELRNRVVNYLEENGHGIQLLFGLLETWSRERIRGYGLPQGPPASAFLADIFLDYVDRRMEKYEGYFRYMDDIRIFCKREIDAKLALKDLIIALRDLKLNINAKKTGMEQAELTVPLRPDLFHLLREAGVLMRSLERQAYKAIELSLIHI